MDPLSDQLCRACRECADTNSIGVLSHEFGIAKTAISRLIVGERGVSAKTLDKLDAMLGLFLTRDGKAAQRC